MSADLVSKRIKLTETFSSKTFGVVEDLNARNKAQAVDKYFLVSGGTLLCVAVKLQLRGRVQLFNSVPLNR